jgi:hypothetical protein
MSWLWGNPTPSEATPAALSSRYEVSAPNIGPIIAAIMAQRDRKQKEDQAALNSLISGVGSVAGGAMDAYQGGQRDDAANAAIYGAQYPNDPYGGYTDPDRVPDYGGTNALRSAMIQKQLTVDPYKQQYEQARIQAMQALAGQRWSNYGSGYNGSNDNGMTPRQNINTLKEAQNEAGDAFGEFGLSRDALNGPNIHAPSDTPYVYSAGASATTVPQDQLLIVDPKDGSYHYVTKDYLDSARAALESYKNAQQTYRNTLSTTGQAPPAQSGALPTSVSQNDVNQASQTMAKEGGVTDPYSRAVQILRDNGKPVTDANVKYVMDQLAQ